MADIFISYKRENQDAVQRIVQGLRASGLSVWWDQDIAPDDPWEATIERELEKSKVVVVAWSLAAVASENVKAEARRARQQGKLLQLYVEPCEPPLFFGERQGVVLANWNGDVQDNRFQAVVTACKSILVGKKPPEGVGYRPRKRTPWATLTALFLVVSAALGFLSNAGGARDAICSFAATNPTCVRYGLILPATPSAEELRRRLLGTVNGAWGRLDRDCADTVKFRVERDANGVTRIHGTGADGFISTMQVIAVDAMAGTITARATAPNDAGAREIWEYRPAGDVLAMRDQRGTETTLARCAVG